MRDIVKIQLDENISIRPRRIVRVVRELSMYDVCDWDDARPVVKIWLKHDAPEAPSLWFWDDDVERVWALIIPHAKEVFDLRTEIDVAVEKMLKEGARE